MLITWAVMFVLGYFYFEHIDQKHTKVRDDLEATQTSVDQLSKKVQAGDPAVNSELSTLKEELSRLTQQIDTHKQALGDYQDNRSLESSQRAVSRVQAANLAAQVMASRQRLADLKALDAQWQVQVATLLSGEAGRRVVASPAQLELLHGVLERQRPTTDQIRMWDTQVTELASPIELALAEAQAVVALDPNHPSLLDDLAGTITEAAADWEQQQLLLTAILNETASVAPADTTLEEVLAERNSMAALNAALEFTEEQNRQVAAERDKTTQAILDARLEQERALREVELAAIAANANIEKQQIEDAIAEVKRQEAQRQAELKARIERETAEAKFQQQLPEIRRYLTPFITPGNKQLVKGKWKYVEEKATLSLGGIQAVGALEDTVTGHQKFMFLAGGNENDRPNGVFREYIGGHVHDPRDVVRAQNLLKEFDDLLVEKKMLEP
jgi:chromosome segregation ATPase